jgi:hypothetical protein
MSVYLDASFLVALFIEDVHSERAGLWWSQTADAAILSAFAGVEFSAVVSRCHRTGRLARLEAQQVLTDFDRVREHPIPFLPNSETFDLADALVRDFSLKLAAPDALHLASAMQLGAALATFDERLASAARDSNVKLAF